MPNGDAATVCEQRLLKALDSLEKAESLIAALQAEIEARKRLESVNAEIIRTKEAVIGEQKRLIEILQKNARRKISIAFGLIKIHY